MDSWHQALEFLDKLDSMLNVQFLLSLHVTLFVALDWRKPVMLKKKIKRGKR